MLFTSSGKLLITGEYLVLDGAKSLALATHYGQSMEVNHSASETPQLIWKSLDENQNRWFEVTYSLPELHLIYSSEFSIAENLTPLLQKCFSENPSLYIYGKSIEITTSLEFNKSWGLGSSSTLISNLSKWSGVNAFELLKSISKGSGYDVAVGLENNSIIYKRENNQPVYEKVNFNPSFKDHIYFVYLGNKQKSELEIAKYKNSDKDFSKEIQRVSEITEALLECDNLSQFEMLLEEHESIISSVLKTPTIKAQLFNDYTSGIIKSLGAWGGDFILVTAKNNNDLNYFKHKGYNTIVTFEEMILAH
jgi:mevalonate kinase